MMHRPPIARITRVVAEAFDVEVDAVLSFKRSGGATRARFACALVAHEGHGYPIRHIGLSMGRDHSSVYYSVMCARALVLQDSDFAGRVANARGVLAEPEKPKIYTTEEIHKQRLDANKAQILKLRGMGWSMGGLSRRFEIPKHVIAPLIGVEMVER